MAVILNEDTATFSSDEYPELAVTASRSGDVWVFNPAAITADSVPGMPVEFVCETDERRDEVGYAVVDLMVTRRVAQQQAQDDFISAAMSLLVP